jgi:hypothetical protein
MKGMGILELIVVLATIAGLFVWNRAESRVDSRHMETLIKSNRDLIDANITAMREEMKDFHGRLCAIEERGRK